MSHSHLSRCVRALVFAVGASVLFSGCAHIPYDPVEGLKNVRSNMQTRPLAKSVTEQQARSIDNGIRQLLDPSHSLPPAAEVEDKLREIAYSLGISPSDKNAMELCEAIEIKIYVDKSRKGFPRYMLSESGLEDACSNASKDDKEILHAYQEFILSLNGKSFLVIP